jgi:hypothetical protein
MEKKCIRRLYKDPMTATGEWNVILNISSSGQAVQAGAGGASESQVYVVPEKVLSSVRQPVILGVVSSSKNPSVRIYNDQESYDKWLFYYGQDPKKLPKIIFYGEKSKTP